MQGWSNPRFKEALPTIFFCPPDLICLSSTDLICWAQPSTINGRVWIQLMSTFKRWKAPKTSEDEKPRKEQHFSIPQVWICAWNTNTSNPGGNILILVGEIYWSWLGPRWHWKPGLAPGLLAALYLLCLQIAIMVVEMMIIMSMVVTVMMIVDVDVVALVTLAFTAWFF